jgi:hypothetical protein
MAAAAMATVPAMRTFGAAIVFACPVDDEALAMLSSFSDASHYPVILLRESSAPHEPETHIPHSDLVHFIEPPLLISDVVRILNE